MRRPFVHILSRVFINFQSTDHLLTCLSGIERRLRVLYEMQRVAFSPIAIVGVCVCVCVYASFVDQWKTT